MSYTLVVTRDGVAIPRLSVTPAGTKGDLVGHPFRGNQHYHVEVDVASGRSQLIEHDHRNFGPPHTHNDTAGITLASPSMLDRATAEDALRRFQARGKAASLDALDVLDGELAAEPDWALSLDALDVLGWEPDQADAKAAHDVSGEPRDDRGRWSEGSLDGEPGDIVHFYDPEIEKQSPGPEPSGWGLMVGHDERMAQTQALLDEGEGFQPTCEWYAAHGQMDKAVEAFTFAWTDSAATPMAAMAQQIFSERYGGMVWTHGQPAMEPGTEIREVVAEVTARAQQSVSDLPERITVYRGVQGAAISRNALESWSLDRAQAERFADWDHRRPPGGFVLEATVPRSAVFLDARSQSSFERELVLIGGKVPTSSLKVTPFKAERRPYGNEGAAA